MLGRNAPSNAAIPCGSSAEKQRSQTAFLRETLRAADLLSVACVGSVVTARCGDTPTSPPCPQPKSLAAAPLIIFKPALKQFRGELAEHVIGDDKHRLAGKTKPPRLHRSGNHRERLARADDVREQSFPRHTQPRNRDSHSINRQPQSRHRRRQSRNPHLHLRHRRTQPGNRDLQSRNRQLHPGNGRRQSGNGREH